MNHVSVPRCIYKNASIETKDGNKQSLKTQGITTLTSPGWGPPAEKQL